MNEQIVVRKALLSDMPVLLEFEQKIIEAERPFDVTLQPENIHYYNLNEMIRSPLIQLVVAEINNEVIGCGYARIENAKPFFRHARHGYLGFMYVLPGYRGKGVNGKIIHALKEWSDAQGITEFRLEVYFDNISAIKAYEKLGFKKLVIEMRMNVDE